MRTNRNWMGLAIVAAVSVGATFAAGCSGKAPADGADCAVGSESCACTAGGSCDDGLTCLSAVCVDTGSGTHGTTGSGGTTVGGGTGGSGGAGGAGGTGGSGGMTDAGGTGTDPAIEAACTTEADAYCQKLADCQPLSIQSTFGDIETCRARKIKACVPYRRLAGTSETAEKTLTCAAALTAASCSEWLYDFERALSACLEQPGSLSNGAACGSNAQCQTTMCVAKASATCGVCGPAHGPGETCSGSGDCLGQIPCINGICIKPAAAGSVCTVNDQCLPGLVCKSGSCAPAAQLGESCSATPCDPAQWLFCSSSTSPSRCQKLTLAAPGEACRPYAGLYCDHGAVCRLTGDAGTGTCVAAVADGAPCSTTSGPCMAYSQCINGTCQAPNPAVCK